MVGETKDQESAVVPVPGTPVEQPKTRKSLSRTKRELTDEEFESAAVGKMLLDEIERLEGDNAELVAYRDRFHQADKDCAVLREQQKGSLATDLVFTAGMTLGGILLGLLQSIPSRTSFWEVLVVAVLMMATGLMAKFIRR